MIVHYFGQAFVDHLSPDELDDLIHAIDSDSWFVGSFKLKGNIIHFDGECEVDDYSTDERDVADALNCMLQFDFDVDSNIRAHQVEPDDPNWDAMPGGYDYF